MYESHFGLTQKPFGKTPDPAFLYRGRQHAEALARLLFAVEERELAVLTGEIGAGKTLLSRALIDEAGTRCRFILVLNPRLTPANLLKTVAEGIGLKTRRGTTPDVLAARLSELDAEGSFPVVLIDEAQLLSKAVFDELRLLTNLQLDDRNLIGIVLLGQPELRERLRKPTYEAFRQRVGVSYHLGPLDREELGRYVAHRLQVAGCAVPLFSEAALDRIFAASGGVPRRVNHLCGSALLEAFGRGVKQVDEKIAEDAIRDVESALGA
jgi:type II secretory pathway predicted ATPase ExeA